MMARISSFADYLKREREVLLPLQNRVIKVMSLPAYEKAEMLIFPVIMFFYFSLLLLSWFLVWQGLYWLLIKTTNSPTFGFYTSLASVIFVAVRSFDKIMKLTVCSRYFDFLWKQYINPPLDQTTIETLTLWLFAHPEISHHPVYQDIFLNWLEQKSDWGHYEFELLEKSSKKFYHNQKDLKSWLDNSENPERLREEARVLGIFLYREPYNNMEEVVSKLEYLQQQRKTQTDRAYLNQKTEISLLHSQSHRL